MKKLLAALAALTIASAYAQDPMTRCGDPKLDYKNYTVVSYTNSGDVQTAVRNGQLLYNVQPVGGIAFGWYPGTTTYVFYQVIAQHRCELDPWTDGMDYLGKVSRGEKLIGPQWPFPMK